MKLKKQSQWLASVAAAAITCLPLSGCGGGGGSSHEGPIPVNTALFAPYLGTYSVISTANPNNPQLAFTLTLAMGTGHFYGSSEPVVTETTTEPGHVQGDGENAKYWSKGKAYLRDATLSADGTQITQLNFIFAGATNPNYEQLSMSIAPTATAGVYTGEVTEATTEPPLATGNYLTYTRQPQ